MDLERMVADLAEKIERRFYGKYRGLVVDNADPSNLGRLRVNVPSVLGSDIVTGWALPCVPYGGAADQGFLFVPDIGAGVWVEFEEGDLEFPIWVGAYWSQPTSQSEVPKPNDAAGSEQGSVQTPPTRKIIKTAKGHTIQFEDQDGEEMVTIIENCNGQVITMNKDGITITDGANHNDIALTAGGVTITDGANSNTIKMDSSRIVIQDKALNKIEMTAKAITISPAVACNLGSGAVNLVNNLPACLFTGAPHAMDLKGQAQFLA